MSKVNHGPKVHCFDLRFRHPVAQGANRKEIQWFCCFLEESQAPAMNDEQERKTWRKNRRRNQRNRRKNRRNRRKNRRSGRRTGGKPEENRRKNRRNRRKNRRNRRKAARTARTQKEKIPTKIQPNKKK